MSSTKDAGVNEVESALCDAGALFDEVLVPLAESRRAAGKQPYFELSADSAESSYYQEPVLKVMAAADFEFPGAGDVDGLIDRLAELWTAQGETQLAAMAPRLKELAAVLKKESAEGDGSVSALCYTMF